MANYRLLTPNTVTLSDGTELGHQSVLHSDVNGKSLSKGAGAVKFKEVSASNEPIQGAREYSYSFGQIIELGA